MKVIEKGNGAAGWSKQCLCTGKGNGNGGCGATLLVEKGDLFLTFNSCRDETDTFVTFECAECKVLTDIDGVPPYVRELLPSKQAWDKGRQ